MKIKFRSWNQKLQKLFYFFNGQYFSDEACRAVNNDFCFDWSNAEQLSPCTDRDGRELYTGDTADSSMGFGQVLYTEQGFMFDFDLDIDTLFNMTIGGEKKDFVKIGHVHQDKKKRNTRNIEK